MPFSAEGLPTCNENETPLCLVENWNDILVYNWRQEAQLADLPEKSGSVQSLLHQPAGGYRLAALEISSDFWDVSCDNNGHQFCLI